MVTGKPCCNWLTVDITVMLLAVNTTKIHWDMLVFFLCLAIIKGDSCNTVKIVSIFEKRFFVAVPYIIHICHYTLKLTKRKISISHISTFDIFECVCLKNLS